MHYAPSTHVRMHIIFKEDRHSLAPMHRNIHIVKMQVQPRLQQRRRRLDIVVHDQKLYTLTRLREGARERDLLVARRSRRVVVDRVRAGKLGVRSGIIGPCFRVSVPTSKMNLGWERQTQDGA